MPSTFDQRAVQLDRSVGHVRQSGVSTGFAAADKPRTSAVDLD
jgi:hypothetical protein